MHGRGGGGKFLLGAERSSHVITKTMELLILHYRSPHVHMTCLPMGLGCSGSLEPTAYRVPISILVHFGFKSSAATERFRFRHDLRLACEMYVIFNPLVSLFKL